MGERTIALAPVVAFVVAMAVTAVVAASHGWIPISDDALIELAVRDVPGNLPLTGVYSRFGWDHPGPTWFYLLAVPYRLLGSASVGLLVGALVAQTAATVTAWWVARRQAPLAGGLVLIALLGVLVSTPAWAVRSPWNPQVALVGTGLLVVVAWGASTRQSAPTALVLPLSSLLVQAHLVTAPTVACIAGAGLVTGLVIRDSEGRGAESELRYPLRGLWIGVGVTVVMWLPPLVQQLTGDPGNLSALIDRQAEGPAEGLVHALGTLTHLFGPVPLAFEPTDVTSVFVPTSFTVPIWAVLPIAAAVVAFRRRDRRHLLGLAIATSGLLGATIGFAIVSGGLFDYLVVGSRSVVAVTLAISVSALLAAARVDTTVAATATVSAVACVLCVVLAVAQLRGDNPAAGYGPTVERLRDAVLASDVDGTLAVDSAFDFRAAEMAPALALQLERAGRSVTSAGELADRLGDHRAEREPAHYVLVAPLEQRDQLLDEGWTILETYQPLSDDVARRAAVLRTERDDLGRSDEGDAQHRFDRMMQIDAELARIEEGRAPMMVAIRPAG